MAKKMTKEETLKMIGSVQEEIDALLSEKADVEKQVEEKKEIARRTSERMSREISRGLFEAKKKLILQVFPIVDNLDRAVKASKTTKNFDALLEGLKMVSSQVDALLDEYGICENTHLCETSEEEKNEEENSGEEN